MVARDRLSDAFGRAAPAHFAWQTGAPFVAERERELTRAAFLPLGKRILDLGCGEGATLVHLGEPAGVTGVDLFEQKLVFARARLPASRFVVASAESLPFPDGSFDHVIVRDVIHHLDEPARAIEEICRVLTPGGKVDVLEPCGYNPLIALHAVTHPVERLELRSNGRYLRSLLGGRLQILDLRYHQALPIHRLIFHPELGRPSLADNVFVRSLTHGIERLASSLLPRWAWAYVHVRAVFRAAQGEQRAALEQGSGSLY